MMVAWGMLAFSGWVKKALPSEDKAT